MNILKNVVCHFVQLLSKQSQNTIQKPEYGCGPPKGQWMDYRCRVKQFIHYLREIGLLKLGIWDFFILSPAHFFPYAPFSLCLNSFWLFQCANVVDNTCALHILHSHRVSRQMLNPVPKLVHFLDFLNFGVLYDFFLWSVRLKLCNLALVIYLSILVC